MKKEKKKIKTNFLTRTLLVATVAITITYGLLSSAAWLSLAFPLFALNVLLLLYGGWSRHRAEESISRYDERIHKDVDRSARNGFVFLMLSLSALLLVKELSAYQIDLPTSVVELQMIGFAVYYLSRLKYAHQPS